MEAVTEALLTRARPLALHGLVSQLPAGTAARCCWLSTWHPNDPCRTLTTPRWVGGGRGWRAASQAAEGAGGAACLRDEGALESLRSSHTRAAGLDRRPAAAAMTSNPLPSIPLHAHASRQGACTSSTVPRGSTSWRSGEDEQGCCSCVRAAAVDDALPPPNLPFHQTCCCRPLFPPRSCNQFGGQAPGTSQEERAWAWRKFGELLRCCWPLSLVCRCSLELTPAPSHSFLSRNRV